MCDYTVYELKVTIVKYAYRKYPYRRYQYSIMIAKKKTVSSHNGLNFVEK